MYLTDLPSLLTDFLPTLMIWTFTPLLTRPRHLLGPPLRPLDQVPYRTDLPSLLTDFLPTLMIWTFTVLLPVLVVYSDRLLGHWTR
jgi:hypothetical protein